MNSHSLPAKFISLPKAELHLHLEGAIEPSTVRELSASYGEAVSEQEARQRYSCRNFAEFLEAFKWVTSYLREPEDYALITRRLGERLLKQGVVYAEVSLSVGVMLLRKQVPEANFEAICSACTDIQKKGLKLQWVFDAVRQFGAEAAMNVARIASAYRKEGVVAFGMGGDELSIRAEEFRGVYEFAAQQGLHRLLHAGEIGGPEQIRDAIELLGAERIGHGIAAMHDPALLEILAERQIPLEVCPTSNICTGALAKQLGKNSARIEEHPLPGLLRRGVPIVLSTDDPAMFHTSLLEEYANTAKMGLREEERSRLVELSFVHAFLPAEDRRALAGARRGEAV